MKKLEAVPQPQISKISHEKFYEQIILYDKDYIVAVVHIDTFYDKAGSEIYDALNRGKTVWFTMSLCDE